MKNNNQEKELTKSVRFCGCCHKDCAEGTHYRTIKEHMEEEGTEERFNQAWDEGKLSIRDDFYEFIEQEKALAVKAREDEIKQEIKDWKNLYKHEAGTGIWIQKEAVLNLLK